jgi:hypothetical protein
MCECPRDNLTVSDPRGRFVERQKVKLPDEKQLSHADDSTRLREGGSVSVEDAKKT